MNTKGIFSHKTDDWSTPKEIYNWYVKDLQYYDPCPLNADFDGLKEEWKGDVFINPPYSDVEAWVKKAIEYKNKHRYNDVVMLLPVRTDTHWFEILSAFGCSIRFFRGRLKFGNSKLGAPFPSMLVKVRDDNNSYTVIERDYFK